jgi:hypothetical protein
MLQIKSSSVPVIKVLCECAAFFWVGKLEKDAVEADGHHFIKTRFAVRAEQGIFPLYFCRCGEMALRHEEMGQTMCSLTSNGCECALTHCRRDSDSTVH